MSRKAFAFTVTFGERDTIFAKSDVRDREPSFHEIAVAEDEHPVGCICDECENDFRDCPHPDNCVCPPCRLASAFDRAEELGPRRPTFDELLDRAADLGADHV